MTGDEIINTAGLQAQLDMKAGVSKAATSTPATQSISRDLNRVRQDADKASASLNKVAELADRLRYAHGPHAARAGAYGASHKAWRGAGSISEETTDLVRSYENSRYFAQQHLQAVGFRLRRGIKDGDIDPSERRTKDLLRNLSMAESRQFEAAHRHAAARAAPVLKAAAEERSLNRQRTFISGIVPAGMTAQYGEYARDPRIAKMFGEFHKQGVPFEQARATVDARVRVLQAEDRRQASIAKSAMQRSVMRDTRIDRYATHAMRAGMSPDAAYMAAKMRSDGVDVATTKQRVAAHVSAEQARGRRDRHGDDLFGFDASVRHAYARYHVARTFDMLLGAPARRVFQQGAQTKMGIERSMVDAIALMSPSDQATPGLLGTLTETAMGLTSETMFDVEQIGDGFRMMANAGYDVNQMLHTMGTVTEFAQAGLFGIDKSVTMLTDTLNALGMGGGDPYNLRRNMANISSALIGAGTLSTATAEQFGEALAGQFAGQLRITGMDAVEGLSILTAFASRGIKGRTGGRQATILLRDLGRAAALRPGVWQEHGVSVYDDGQFRSMPDILDNLKGALADMTPEAGVEMLNKLGLNRRVLGNVLLLLDAGDEMRRVDPLLRQMQEEEKAKQVADMRMDVSQRELEKFFREFRYFLSELIPDMKEYISVFRDVLSVVRLLPDPLKKTLGVLIGGVGVASWTGMRMIGMQLAAATFGRGAAAGMKGGDQPTAGQKGHFPMFGNMGQRLGWGIGGMLLGQQIAPALGMDSDRGGLVGLGVGILGYKGLSKAAGWVGGKIGLAGKAGGALGTFALGKAALIGAAVAGVGSLAYDAYTGRPIGTGIGNVYRGTRDWLRGVDKDRGDQRISKEANEMLADLVILRGALQEQDLELLSGTMYDYVKFFADAAAEADKLDATLRELHNLGDLLDSDRFGEEIQQFVNNARDSIRATAEGLNQLQDELRRAADTLFEIEHGVYGQAANAIRDMLVFTDYRTMFERAKKAKTGRFLYGAHGVIESDIDKMTPEQAAEHKKYTDAYNRFRSIAKQVEDTHEDTVFAMMLQGMTPAEQIAALGGKDDRLKARHAAFLALDENRFLHEPGNEEQLALVNRMFETEWMGSVLAPMMQAAAAYDAEQQATMSNLLRDIPIAAAASMGSAEVWDAQVQAMHRADNMWSASQENTTESLLDKIFRLLETRLGTTRTPDSDDDIVGQPAAIIVRTIEGT